MKSWSRFIDTQICFACRVVVGLLFLTTVVHGAESKPESIDFNQHIRPILSDKCFYCHGPDKKHREGGLRLDESESAFGEAESGEVAIVPGKPEQSELMRRILAADDDERMPLPESGKTLSDEEIDRIRRWIQQGAPYQKHWAYVTPINSAAPEVANKQWPINQVDHFVLAKLEASGLKPAADADRVTLIRRLYFDLIGLPPSPTEVDAFVNEKAPQAYERVVDRLLASSHYGERMAMYWLDLVRYADTVGYHGDQDHSISPYRDYVIDAFNRNMPLDQFTREQLAGDLIAARDADKLDAGRITDLKVASGYNRLLQTTHEGGLQKKEYLAIYAADRIRNFSNVWMGATMGCCQCHDHKFDPLTAKDFYSLASFFADVDEMKTFSGSNSLPTKREPELAVLSRQQREQIAALEEQIAVLQAADEKDPRIAEVVKQRDAVRKQTRKTMITVAVAPRTIRVLPRGNWLDDSGEVVEPAIPVFFGKLETDDRRATRLDLANWLVDAESGGGKLTARVFANRFWYLLFGAGIAGVLDDFGGQGEPPVHPELLDMLALELTGSEWDVKAMMRLLVTSRAYRQSSVASPELLRRDPGNRLIARQSRFRLPAETIRDSALAISGLLVRDLGGASARPYQPAGYYRHLNFPQRKYQHHADDRQWRRGVYVHWQRQFLHPMLKAFDAPSREECTAQRPRSNTPLAALTLLNDPTFVEAARVFATRILREGGDDDNTRLEFACRWTISRVPDSTERAILTELLQSNRTRYQAALDAAKKLVATGHAPVPTDLDVAELAAWTEVARALLNMHETITRN